MVDSTGKSLWKGGAKFGVNGAHWGDFDGDGTDEMVVGMNGMGGLQAWSADGQKLWSVRLGNVWDQAIVPASEGHPARILATEAGGAVRVYDAQGNPLAPLRPRGAYYAGMSACRTTGGAVQIAAQSDETTVFFDEAGKIAWTAATQEDSGGWRANSLAAGDADGDGAPDWAFIDGSGRLVVASPAGEQFTALAHAADVEGFAIASRAPEPGVLVVLAESTLSACTLAR